MLTAHVPAGDDPWANKSISTCNIATFGWIKLLVNRINYKAYP